MVSLSSSTEEEKASGAAFEAEFEEMDSELIEELREVLANVENGDEEPVNSPLEQNPTSHQVDGQQVHQVQV